jgi:hypothetical protein
VLANCTLRTTPPSAAWSLSTKTVRLFHLLLIDGSAPSSSNDENVIDKKIKEK